MSGHSEFAPIGNHIPAVNPPPIGGVEHNVQQSTNVPGVQPQGQQQAVELVCYTLNRRNVISHRRACRPGGYVNR